MSRPASVKGVCALPDGRVLLCRNHRGDWELPGGRPEPGESHAECLVREVWVQTGVAVRVDRPLGTVPLEVVPGRWVDLIGYTCTPVSAVDPVASVTVSGEHVEAAFVDPETLHPDALPTVYRRLIARATRIPR